MFNCKSQGSGLIKHPCAFVSPIKLKNMSDVWGKGPGRYKTRRCLFSLNVLIFHSTCFVKTVSFKATYFLNVCESIQFAKGFYTHLIIFRMCTWTPRIFWSTVTSHDMFLFGETQQYFHANYDQITETASCRLRPPLTPGVCLRVFLILSYVWRSVRYVMSYGLIFRAAGAGCLQRAREELGPGLRSLPASSPGRPGAVLHPVPPRLPECTGLWVDLHFLVSWPVSSMLQHEHFTLHIIVLSCIDVIHQMWSQSQIFSPQCSQQVTKEEFKLSQSSDPVTHVWIS